MIRSFLLCWTRIIDDFLGIVILYYSRSQPKKKTVLFTKFR